MTVLHDDSTVLCGHDVALIVLDRAITDMPIAPVRLDSGVRVEDVITAVGWGLTESETTPAHRKQRTGIPIARVGPQKQTIRSSALTDADFQIGEGICSGDSGGPAFDESTGAIVGVVSRGGGGQAEDAGIVPAEGCVGSFAQNIYTSVAPFRDLVLQAYETAGATPWLEGQANPLLAVPDAGVDGGADGGAANGGIDDGASTTGCSTAKKTADSSEGSVGLAIATMVGVVLTRARRSFRRRHDFGRSG